MQRSHRQVRGNSTGGTYRSGFTLIELLVAMAVIGVLVALLLPAVMQAREAARQVQCRNHLKQIGLALHNYHDQHLVFPLGARNEWSWIAPLLPHLEQGGIYNGYDFDIEPFLPPNTEFTDLRLDVLACPSDPENGTIYVSSALGDIRFAHTNYLGTERANSPPSRGMFGYNVGLRMADVIDGASQTLFVGERPVVSAGGQTYGWWVWGGSRDTLLPATEPLRPGRSDDPGAIDHWWSYHDGGVHFAFVDGSVRFLSYNLNEQTFIGLGTADGGEVAFVE